MTTRSLNTRLAALILAVMAVTLSVFPRAHTTIEALGRTGPDGRVYSGAAIDPAHTSLPLIFEINRGQAEADVRFVGRARDFALLLKADEAVFSLRTPRPSPDAAAATRTSTLNPEESPTLVSMKLEGAVSTPIVSGEGPQIARANYFIGNDPDKWIRGVETYSSVVYSSVYAGVDLVFYGNERELEYDFTVAPGADPRAIRLRFEGADDLSVNSDGALVLRTRAGEVKHERPFVYQESNGSRSVVAAAFNQFDDGSIGFDIGEYDKTQPLVIDPILVYSTYLGGMADDFGRGIVADSAGNAFVMGDSFSSNFLRQASPTNSDVFIGKLALNGLLLAYTYFGGSKNDTATGLAVDAAGNLYLGGSTQSADFPIFNSVGSVMNGPSDAFAVKLTPSADQFFYSSLVGGSGQETGIGIAADTLGNAYITGRTSSQDYPTVAAIQPVYGGGDSDAFISKVLPDGKALAYSTFLGGGAVENASDKSGISIDAAGNVYIAGDTQSTDFPTVNALRTTKNGPASSSDGFAAKLNPAGTNFIYATYLGGADDDFALAVGADQAGNAYVTGRTKSPSFTGSGTPKVTTATADAFVAKLNATGSAISYLNFIGGNLGDESGNAIAVDSGGNAVIAGSAGVGTPTIDAILSSSRGAGDVFVAKLGPNGAVTFSSYLGGSGEDTALGVGVDGTGSIYVTGVTGSTDFLTVSPLVRENQGARDILIAKIDPNTNPDGPVLLQVLISGKHLLVFGQGFDSGAQLRVNDVPFKTKNEEINPSQILNAKKAAKRIPDGATVQLQVRNANEKRSNLLFWTKPE